MSAPNSNPLCDEIRNIARDAPMSAGTRTRLHAIAHEIEKALRPADEPSDELPSQAAVIHDNGDAYK